MRAERKKGMDEDLFVINSMFYVGDNEDQTAKSKILLLG